MIILQSGPSSESMRSQAFKQDMNRGLQAASSAYNQNMQQEERTLRQRALEEQGRLENLAIAEKFNTTPEAVQEFKQNGLLEVMGADNMGPPAPTQFGKDFRSYRERKAEAQQKERQAEERRAGLQDEKLEAEVASLTGRPERDRIEQERKALAQNQETTDKLRKEVSQNQATKNYQSVVGAANKVFESAKDPSAAGDIAMVFNFMKVMDPGSVVREGEFATAASAAGLPDRIIQLADRVDNGMRLTREQRADFLNATMRQAEAQRNVFSQTIEPIALSARERGLDTSRIIPEFVLPDINQLPKSGVPLQGLADVNQSMNQGYDPNGNPIDAIIPQANAIEQQQLGRIPKDVYEKANSMSRKEKLKFLGIE